jgi:hypothetical protein
MNEQIDQMTADDKKCSANIVWLVKMRRRRFVKGTATMQSHLREGFLLSERMTVLGFIDFMVG